MSTISTLLFKTGSKWPYLRIDEAVNTSIFRSSVEGRQLRSSLCDPMIENLLKIDPHILSKMHPGRITDPDQSVESSMVSDIDV
jgi:hypothetical protein